MNDITYTIRLLILTEVLARLKPEQGTLIQYKLISWRLLHDYVYTL